MDASALAALFGIRLDSPMAALHFTEAVSTAAAKLGLTRSALILATRRGTAAYHALANELTVRETYFFRSPRDFETLSAHSDARARAGAPYTSAWSVGCATGEEVYSLASVLGERGEALTIVGSDVCRSALRVAETGVYRANSFRHRAAATIRGVRPDGSAWKVMAHLREGVSFTELNLALDAILPPAPLRHRVDVIFCRNVLLYLTPDVVARVLPGLVDALSPGGLLVISPNDMPTSLPPGVIAVGENALLRADDVPEPSPSAPPRGESTRRSAHRSRASTIRRAWKAADAGRSDEAIALTDGLEDTDALLLRATVFAERDQGSSAEALLRHVLLLDPGHVAALAHLFVLYQRRGARLDAERLKSALLPLLEGREGDEPLEGGTLSVGEVRSLLREADE